ADAHHVDEGVLGVALVERHFSPDGGHTHRVAVAGDAVDHALEEPAGAGRGEGAGAQWVKSRDRTGAHREDVAQDATDAGGRPLMRLDRTRVIVALDADGDGDAVTGV